MKKLIIVLSLLFIVIVPMAGAQEEEALPSCTAEEFAEFATALGEAFAETEDLFTLPEDATTEDLMAQVVITDAFSYGYWEGYYEAEIACAEASWLGLVVGLMLDEQLIVTQLAALTAYEAEAGEDEIAEALLELATDRQVALEATGESLGEIISGVMSGEAELDFELAECSEEDLEATYAGLEEIAASYEELSGLAEEAEGSDLSVMVSAFGVLSNGYWGEFYPVVPMCYEAQDEAIFAGLIIDESLIVVANFRLAEFADEETAEVLLESAATRLEELEEILEYYYGEDE